MTTETLTIQTLQLNVEHDNLGERLATIVGQFEQEGDLTNAEKVRQLIEKLQDGEFAIAFCGHFSAGKSTMINTLLGADILPSSPIPTSANVVTIRGGESYARAYLNDGDYLEFDVAKDLEKIKNYAVDGTVVERIDISTPSDLLKPNVSVMDTPGIDSTDDAHKVATESALHLADVVLYMMDYNHVQSELNFAFTKTLKDRGKPVYLVVNMIDKHMDYELDFNAYRESVIDGFATWGIEPDGLFFTSLRKPDHPENMYEALQAKISELFVEKDSLLVNSIVASAAHLIDEHRKVIAAQNAEKKRNHQSVLDRIENQDELLADAETARSKYQAILRAPEELAEGMKKEINSLLDNAKLTPFQTTELGGAYLKSRKPGFKVGFLFGTKEKTQQEIENRLAALFTDFQDKVKSNIDWHIRDLLVKIAEKHGVREEAYAKSVYEEFSVDYDASLLASLVKEGGLSSDEYMYQYAKDISAEVKSLYRREAQRFIERAVLVAEGIAKEQGAELAAEVGAADDILAAKRALQGLENAEKGYVARLIDLLIGTDSAALNNAKAIAHAQAAATVVQGDVETADAEEETTVEFSPIKVLTGSEPAAKPKTTAPVSVFKNPDSVATKMEGFKSQLHETAGKLRTAAGSVQEITGLKSLAQAMTARAERLEQNVFTVALFGAFSAGKSSFANALLGEMVLPVSPNPTTAAINKILPPTEQYPHGSVRVKIKSVTDITLDVQGSLAVFGLTATTLDDAMTEISTIDPSTVQPNAKPHFSFLKAVAKGLAPIRDYLGHEILVDMDEFKAIVGREEKACFAEWIELYYDCPLTAQGITLVDTPGADSINARHTGVAFNYIKNADAVLFVTYYNHAFANADREFLIQLGRVKDTFEMDKMFFIVNAADLAKDEEELRGVVGHVRKNLISCGISMPRIYPVSSQTALLARMHEKGELAASAEPVYRQRTGRLDGELMPATEALQLSGISSFEKDFLSFTIQELTQIAVQSALAEIKRATATLDDLLQTANENESDRAAKRLAADTAISQAKAGIRAADVSSEEKALYKEVDELIYYVNQRVFFRFSDMFKEAFNPSVLQDDGRDLKQALRGSLDELVRSIGYTLGQEMRATALRVEKYVNISGKRVSERLSDVVQKAAPKLVLAPYQPRSFDTPDVPETLDVTLSDFAQTLSIFKNAKDFFERNGKGEMADTLEKQLQAPVSTYLAGMTEQLKKEYTARFTTVVSELKDDSAAQVDEYFAGILAALSANINVEQLAGVREQVGQLIEE